MAAIGNFDGVHLGHRRLLDAVRAEAEARGGAARAVLTFEPHPREVFASDGPAFRLTPEPTKLRVLAAYGIEIVFLRRFDAAFAATGPARFVEDILVRDLAVSGVVVGEGFRFGRARGGDVGLLRAMGAAAGLGVRAEAPVEVDGAPVSSSRIRQALEAGRVAEANRLLGHRWFVEGTVIHGEKRGRTLGYPTANMALPAGCRLRHGIYAVRAAIAPGEVVAGVASFGRRPTFDDGAPLLETFLFDFAGDLYGREIAVELVGWIRGEERFGSAEALVARMDRDAGEARRLLAAAVDPPSLIG